MKSGTSKKILIVFLVVLIATLVGVSIFIASRLQQTQAPTDSSASAGGCGRWVTSDNCGSFCEDYLIDHPNCCGGTTGNSCSGTNPPGDTDPCVITYGGNSFSVNSSCSGRGIQRCTGSYANGCGVSTNCTSAGSVPSGGATYTPNPAPGTCEQIDHTFGDGTIGSGGVCSCTPPQVTATCNQACSTNTPCATGLSCTSGVCRLPSNPTSPTCTPETTTATCNQACSATVPCATGLSCTSGVCRLPSNPTSPTCTPETTAPQCISLKETGSDPLAIGAGNVVQYTLVYQNESTTNPYPNIGLVVQGNRGRDFNRKAQTVVAINPTGGATYDAVNKRWTYKFSWEAADPTSNVVTPLTAGTYTVRVLTNASSSTSTITTPAACLETITLSQTAVEEPLFTILKTSAPVCEANGDAVVNYSITVTNIGAVPGTIDFVQDAYDTQVYNLGILPTAVTPAYGVINTGKITWTGDNSQRTYTAGQAKTFTYSVRIPKANITTFTTTGVLNQALVQFDTSTTNNNTASFDLRTFLTCTVTIPATGIVDDYKFILVGLLFIVLGLIAFRFRIGNQISLFILDKTSKTLNKQTEGLARKIMPYEESIMDDMEKKRKA